MVEILTIDTCRAGRRPTTAASVLATHGRTAVSINDDFSNAGRRPGYRQRRTP